MHHKSMLKNIIHLISYTMWSQCYASSSCVFKLLSISLPLSQLSHQFHWQIHRLISLQLVVPVSYLSPGWDFPDKTLLDITVLLLDPSSVKHSFMIEMITTNTDSYFQKQIDNECWCLTILTIFFQIFKCHFRIDTKQIQIGDGKQTQDGWWMIWGDLFVNWRVCTKKHDVETVIAIGRNSGVYETL